MKVSVLQDSLAQGLNIVSRAVSPRSTLPVLANVLAATDDGRLRLSATNLELGITTWIGAKIEREGSTTVPARTIADLISTLPKDQVHMDLEESSQNLHVSSGTTNTDIKCIDSQEFPPMPTPDLSEGVQINVADLKEMIHQVAFAASQDEARPVLTGVLVVGEGTNLRMAAADGFRLSIRNAELTAEIKEPFSVIIPARALTELARITGDGKEMVTMAFPKGRGQVVFRLRDVELTSQLIEGTFPDFQQVIPTRYETRSIISTEALLKACKQAEIFARESSHIARINIKPGEEEMEPGTVEFFAQSEETGSNETVVDATIEGPSLLIAFNVRYLRDVLEVIGTPNVALETTQSVSPGVLRPLGGNDGFLHVIMPMHF
jgi:DNA polymerase-3 subunit beta